MVSVESDHSENEFIDIYYRIAHYYPLSTQLPYDITNPQTNQSPVSPTHNPINRPAPSIPPLPSYLSPSHPVHFTHPPIYSPSPLPPSLIRTILSQLSRHSGSNAIFSRRIASTVSAPSSRTR